MTNTKSRRRVATVIAFGTTAVLLSGCGPATLAGPPAVPATDTPYSEAERGAYDDLAPFELIDILGRDGQSVSIAIPKSAMCDQDQCAVAAALHFLAMQDDVLAGQFVEEWLTLSSPDCYFCVDVLNVGEGLRSDEIEVEGGYLTLVDEPTVVPDDTDNGFPASDQLVDPDAPPVMLVLRLEQAPVTYTAADGAINERESEFATFVVVMQWLAEERIWRVEGVGLT